MSDVRIDDLPGMWEPADFMGGLDETRPAAGQITYNLWSNKHQLWWRPNSHGYTEDRAEAGLYSEADAIERVIRSAQCGQREQVTCMVAAPQNWGRTP